jgi:transcriptional regulator with XRE-family HTH domain
MEYKSIHFDTVKDMRQKRSITFLDEIALSRLQVYPNADTSSRGPGDWIRILRERLRMTQAELAKGANITQPNLAAIELGKVDPRVSTLRRIYQALRCDLNIEPRLRKPVEEMLRDRARALALKRLKHTMGTMALEEQAPEKEHFKKLLEKNTDEIIRSRRKRIKER